MAQKEDYESKRSSVKDEDAGQVTGSKAPLNHHSYEAIESLILPAIEVMDPAKLRTSNDEMKQIWSDLERAMHIHSCALNADPDGGMDIKESGLKVSYLFQEFFLKLSKLRGLDTLEDLYGMNGANDKE